MNMLICGILLLTSYILGSVNSGILVARIFHDTDIRDHGSHGAGTTNTLRTLGVKAAALVFALDIIKPIIMMIIGRHFFLESLSILPGSFVWLGFACILGQCYPVFFGFKGGKGAASTLGTLIAGFPLALPFATIIFLVTLAISKMVSLSTLLGIGLGTFFVYYFYPSYLLPYVCIVILVFVRHRENIIRLKNGTENKFSIKK